MERAVLTLRAGLGGQLPHSRTQVAGLLNTTAGQIRQVERGALQRLSGLAQTQGCGEGVAAVTVVGGVIGPAELALSPALVAFGNPAYQGAKQTQFGRLGTAPDIGSAGSLPAGFGNGSTNGSTWAIQLLLIMMIVALVGFRRFVPMVVARLLGRPSPARETAPVEPLVYDQEREPESQDELPVEREKIAA
jgi:hypothetical protein